MRCFSGMSFIWFHGCECVIRGDAWVACLHGLVTMACAAVSAFQGQVKPVAPFLLGRAIDDDQVAKLKLIYPC